MADQRNRLKSGNSRESNIQLSQERPCFVYILACSDGSFYVGSTTDVQNRLSIHSTGRGPKYTSSRLPVRLVYQEEHPSISSAVRRERQLKGWSHEKKAALIAGDLAKLKTLGRRRSASN